MGSQYILPSMAAEYLHMDAYTGIGKDSSALNGSPYFERMEQKREIENGGFNDQEINGYYGIGMGNGRLDMFGTLERKGSTLPNNTPIFLSAALGGSYGFSNMTYGFHVGGEYTRYAAAGYAKNMFLETYSKYDLENFPLLPLPFIDRFVNHQLLLTASIKGKWHPRMVDYDAVFLRVAADITSKTGDKKLLLSNGFSADGEGRRRQSDKSEGVDLFTFGYRLFLSYQLLDNLYLSGRYRYNLAASPNETVYTDLLTDDYTAATKKLEVGHDFQGGVHYMLSDSFRINGYATVLLNSSNVEWYDWSKLVYGVNLQWTY